VNAAMLAVFLLGIAAVSYGCWLAYHPAGYIAGGSLALAASFFWARGAS
jgi:hypothetical protein